MVLPPQLLHRRRLPVSGTVRVSGSRSTLTSAERPQLAHEAVTLRTPFWRMLARVIGGIVSSCWFRWFRRALASLRRLMKDEVQGDQEGDLHGEDGHAGRDRDVAPIHGPPSS
jgi:hypothetical protein